MGFGIGMGPRVFRVRVSTRGVGISSGVGPLSVYAGSGHRRRSAGPRRAPQHSARRQAGPVYFPGDTTTTNLVGAGAQELVPSGADELVAHLNRAQRWITGWGWAAAVCALLSFGTPWFVVPTVIALAVAIVGFSRRRVLLNYEVDSDLTPWFDSLLAGWPSLSATHGKWRGQSSTRLHQTHHQKVNAGAAHLVARHPVKFQTTTPAALKTDVRVPTIKAKRHSLMFLPDRVLVKTGRRWSDVDYNDLKVSVSQGRFIETGAVPRDGTKVGETWQYANVKGGPDRRFKNNRRLPVMLYSDIILASSNGLQWSLSLSRHDVTTWWERVLASRPHTPPLATASVAEVVGTPAAPDVAPVSSPGPRIWVEAPAAESPLIPPAGATTLPPAPANPNARYIPTCPTGEPLEPWGRPWNRIEVAGESHHQANIADLFEGVSGYFAPSGGELHEKAVMVPDPKNPHGAGHAIAVFVRGRHVGYVPHNESAQYFGHLSAMTANGAAVTVDARLWATSDYYGSGFRARATLSVPAPDDFGYPPSMPDDQNAMLLPAGNALQVTGEEEHIDFLMPYLGQNVAVTLHNVVIERARKPVELVEVRIEREPVGTFTPLTSAKLHPLVDHLERLARVPVARASVSGNSLKVDVTVYVARAADVPQQWLDAL